MSRFVPLAHFDRVHIVDHDARQHFRRNLLRFLPRTAAEIGQLFLELSDLLVSRCLLNLVIFDCLLCLLGGWNGLLMPLGDIGVSHRISTKEDPGEGVIVLGRNGIELVIVTAGAGNGLAHESPADGIDLLVDDFKIEFLFVLVLVVDWAHHKEPGRGQVLGTLPLGFVGQQVAGHMSHNQLIERTIPAK